MKQASHIVFVSVLFVSVLASCEKENPTIVAGTKTVIANETIDNESIIRSIPEEYIDAARNNLHVAYQHTSHGTHVSRGMFGLPGFKAGDDTKFAISNNDPQSGKLDFRDYALGSYAEPGSDASDLSRDETAFIQATRNYLDDPNNSEINVVMWSWCNIAGHEVEANYLPGMQTLINEYGPGGSRIGSDGGKRENSVAFIFMTGHAQRQGETIEVDNVHYNNELIRQHVLDHGNIDRAFDVVVVTTFLGGI